ncbi:unnamed protein product [Rotaria sp. Silwood2]|nr:unnamed protein product [Rotaria sp. Silwood2]
MIPNETTKIWIIYLQVLKTNETEHLTNVTNYYLSKIVEQPAFYYGRIPNLCYLAHGYINIQLVCIRYEQQQYVESAKYIQKAYNTYSKLSEGLSQQIHIAQVDNNFAKINWKYTGQYDHAAKHLLQALQIDRNNVEIFINIGLIQASAELYSYALNFFSTALLIIEALNETDYLSYELIYREIGQNLCKIEIILASIIPLLASRGVSRRYLLEDLANEILYEIFEYLDVYDIYKGFYNLNKRFQNLTINSNVLTKINISIISKSNFEDYHRNILIPNQNRFNFLRLSNPFAAEIIFSRTRLVLNFIRLEKLILENIQIKHLYKICDNLIHLRKLHSLTISISDYIESLSLIFARIFLLSKLKYCKIEYQTKNYEEPLLTIFTEYDYSPIQSLIINGRFPFDSFSHLLCCLPKLQYISIDCLIQDHYYTEEEEEKLSFIQLKYLKYVSLRIDYVEFKKFEKIITEVFHYVQILRLMTFYDEVYLDAKRWQKLIVTYMPYLRIFDLNHEGSVKTNSLTYHDIINGFNSSFWIENKWFFTHQHIRKDEPDNGILYSTTPYR